MATNFPVSPTNGQRYSPIISQVSQQKLLASDAASSDNFGWSVTLSADGSTAAITARLEDTSPNTNHGAVYIFIRSGSTWEQQAKLLASDIASSDSFGWSVDLSSDGNIVLIGANAEDTSPNSNNGAAYVFTRSGSTWTEEAKLLASDAASDESFGSSVALSLDGSTALIGASNEDTSPNTNNGAAYVFTRSGSTWTQQQKLLASDAASFESFGWSVALSSDGNTALIGAYQEDTSPNTNNGAAYVFTRSGTTWTQQQKLLASDPALSDNFGVSVAVSADGNTAVVGSYAEDTSPNSENGAAYVFTRSGSTWTQQQKLLASDAASSEYFGASVSISSNGDMVLIGADIESTSPNSNNGAAYVFTRSGSTWTQQQKILAADAASSDAFGTSVSLSADGSVALIGAVSESTSPNTGQGAAYVYNTSTIYSDDIYIYNAAKNLWTLDNASPVKAPTTHVFTSSQTWTIPANAKMIHAWVIGAGGGGGSGAINANASSQGGAGGSGGALSRVTHNILAGYNDTTAIITIGAGGSGGLGTTLALGGVGSAGTSGSASVINLASSGSIGAITALGGAGGAGGLQSSSTASNTAQTLGMHYGSSGGGAAGGSSLIYQQIGLSSYGGAAGGGSGGGHPGTDTADRSGGNGGSVVPMSISGGVAFASPAGVSSSTYGPGSGGAGGSSYIRTDGGAGGLYGGGGGGGGSGRSGTSGAGGAGAQGVVVLMVWYG